MSRDYRLFLEDMQLSCEKISRYVEGLSFAQFVSDEKSYDAVLRNLQVIGDAVKQIPEEVRQKYSAVEWRKIGGFRDFVVHEYFGIDQDILWDVIKNQVPTLLEQIKQIDSSEGAE
ncbi:MAG TPA: DUF86 domain-containing protein [Pyrinomonadaceae bacterium]|nr:DUF86 domain-containing protein [Pyrinomonadaceae bacterium]